ncbi:MAG: 4-hydroxythreonine-4-phosphate dehydrogenase PdxA [Firmicutes bacterium]|nr:4-hydroxythreonine-4-phosphate dehydrogenase PdxA [Bacillota bacterium]
MEKAIIAVPMGDPAGIGPEIAVKALKEEELYKRAKPLVVGDRNVLSQALQFCGVKAAINTIRDPREGRYIPGILDLIDLANVEISRLKMGKIQALGGRAAYEYIEKAVQLALDKKVDALATTPINKESLRAAGVPYIGHTEILEDLTKTPNPLTMFQVFDLRVFFLSRHVSLREACDLVEEERVYNFILRSHDALRLLGFQDAKIAVAGLNPHGGEGGLFGREEIEEIKPAIARAVKDGIDVSGPYPADSVFYFGLQGAYDAVLSLYHDQGHIATKMVDFERTISVTNNLPFLRTSVDHGTAFDIAGSGQASAVSMIEAIKLASQYAFRFKRG